MKQRIVGAFVLIALATIIVPILLDLHKDQGVMEQPAAIPPKPKDVTVQVLPLIHPDKPDENPPPAEQASQEQAQAQTQTSQQAPQSDAGLSQKPASSPAPTAVAEATPQPPAQHEAPTAASTPASPAAWAVQVGSFSSQAHAEALRDQLRAKHFTAYVEKVTLDSGKSSYRVRVGPQLLRSDAEKTQRRLQQQVKLSGIVVSH